MHNLARRLLLLVFWVNFLFGLFTVRHPVHDTIFIPMPNSNHITSLMNRSAELRVEYETWQSKNTIQRLISRAKFDETVWEQRVKSLFDRNLFEYLDNHPSFDNLKTIVTELDRFKDLLDYNFLILTWHEVKKRSSMAGDKQKKIDGLIELQLEHAESIKVMCLALNRLKGRP